MRILSSLISLCLTGLSLAQVKTFAGTKSDAVRASVESPSGMGLMPFFQMLIALGIVFALVKFLLPRVIAKMNKRLIPSSGSGIVVEESASFAGGSLLVVNARGRTLLLSVSATGVSCLADLSQAQQPEAPTFLELLERAEQDATVPLSHRTEFAAEPILEDVQRILGQSAEPAVQHAVIEQEVFETRLPEGVKPLPPVTSEPRPWQPRRLTREDREVEIDEILRRLQQLSP
ncbi:MAG: hypothetical protein WAO58_08040 [Fimbriimonadaceae bacterium]